MSPQDSRKKVVNPDMVILARESRGLSQKVLAEYLGVAQSRLSMIEMGLRPISDELFEQLAVTLNYPPTFFFQEGRISGVGIAEVFHRKRQRVSKHVLDKIYALIEIRLRHIRTLLQSVEISCSVPQLDIDDYGGEVEAVARAVRAHLQVSRGPIQDLTQTLEDAGVLVIQFDFETSLVDAISRWIPTMPPLFFVNSRSPKDRYRFSLAHELGHVIMHVLPNPDMEEQANRFAAEFLLPEREVRSDLHDLTLARLSILKRYWRVSMAALLKRAGDLGTITPNQARYLWAQMARAGYKTREPVELDVTGEKPQLLHDLVATHREELGYSLDDLREILPLNEEELRSWYLADSAQPPLRIVR